MFPHHIVWLCKYPELGQFDLSSLLSISVVGSPMNSIYERQIFDLIPHLLFLNNVRIENVDYKGFLIDFHTSPGVRDERNGTHLPKPAT